MKQYRLPFKDFVIASVSINILMAVIVLLIQRWLPPQIPLFYGKPRGEEQLASSLVLTLPSIVSLLILLINVSFAAILKDEFLRKTLVLAAIVVTFFAAITTIKIIFLVGSF
jgi:hypothetical protein